MIRLQIRVETKMHFSVFAKMRKSCENGQIFAKFRDKFSRKSRKFFAKIFAITKTLIFAKIFAKTKNVDFHENLCETCVKKIVLLKVFSDSLTTFAKQFVSWTFNQCCGAGAASFCRNRSRTRCSSGSDGSDSDNGSKHGWELKIDTKCNSL
jgi:hypothetical protein